MPPLCRYGYKISLLLSSSSFRCVYALYAAGSGVYKIFLTGVVRARTAPLPPPRQPLPGWRRGPSDYIFFDKWTRWRVTSTSRRRPKSIPERVGRRGGGDLSLLLARRGRLSPPLPPPPAPRFSCGDSCSRTQAKLCVPLPHAHLTTTETDARVTRTFTLWPAHMCRPSCML
ncbi:hypothetical protein QTP88_007784 [Uroleucon formosanum]